MDDTIRIIGASSHPALTEKICDYIGVRPTKTQVLRFSNENLMVKIEENVRETDAFVVQTANTPVSEGIIELLITIDALKHASAKRITAVIPYFPYARSDKKDQPRISITARLMADLLETAGADRILSMDFHSPQVQGFFRIPADQLKAAPLLCDYLRQNRDLANHVLVAGDVGEAKEIGAYANRLGLPIAIVDKRRDGNDEKARAVSIIGEVAGKHALIVDDEVASGGTLMEAADFVMRQGALSVEAVAVHGVLSGHSVQRISDSVLKSLVISDTIPLSEEKRIDKIEVCSVARLFADAIMAIHSGRSVSSLFL
ncbi:ribose-phosphate diphosphokinase [Hoeflea poritis]|uniref:ribose-phosphate diphosphokinase n=1 Tax=Hoeflea poritis TaxID=2993659 RepID=A0ABT4VQC0_9HYPH|nr:ribose-phosphate pyrophosphokinase [Hoeflea poritis]MDA4846277.1 ribose-phosphate pyrophosphokinase [Hoeflea poritis]